MTDKKSTIFLTGGTGLLGSYLLKIFLQNGHRVFGLARDKLQMEATERVLKALNFWNGEINFKNLFVVKGDITRAGLGLKDALLERLKIEIEEFYHCAATINLKLSWDSVSKVNVLGTQHVLDFAKNCRNLKKINHISTAYIYGNYTGEFKEKDLDVGQRFKTTYEESKFEAEKIVASYRNAGLWIDVFRPPIIIGHSKNGKIFKFYNMYQLLKLCTLGVFDALPTRGFSVRLIPVDTVSEAIYTLAFRAKEKNRNYHIFTKKETAIDEIINCGCGLMGIRRPASVSLRDFDLYKITPTQRAILEQNILSVNLRNQLNPDYTHRILRELGYSFPEVNRQILSRILKYFADMQFSMKGL
jgi:thioester reductase-like protein